MNSPIKIPPPPTKQKLKSIKRDNMGQFIVLMIFIYFISLFINVHFFKNIDLTLYSFFRLNLFFIGLSFLIPINLYRKKLSMSFYEYILNNFLAIGPFLCALFLIVNFIFSGESYWESYNIINKKREGDYVILTLEESQYSNKKYLRKFSYFDYPILTNDFNKLHIQFSDGLFGIRIIEDRLLTN